MEIQDLNPWWKTNRVEEEYEKSVVRPVLKQILKFIDSRQILSFVGLRRTGKTTLMHQIINYLLKRKINSKNIFYYNFDMGLVDIEELLKKYQEIVKIKIKDEKRVFIFLDEIQKLDNWHNKLKLLYDLNRNIKFFISGSASLFIEKKTKESLAGRTFSFQLNVLSFKEFLEFKKFGIKENIDLWKDELNDLLIQYLKTGGFPELVNEKNDEKIKAYLKEFVIDRLVYIDIPQVFKIEEPELLVKLLNIISSNPGAILDFNNLANDLDRNRKTIAAYLFYLEKAFLIKKLYNFSQNILTSEKKSKKFYPSSTAFGYFFNIDISKMVENAIALFLDTKFFYRKLDKEIDFIKVKDNHLEAVEVKYKEKIKKEDFAGIKHFFNNFRKKFSINFILITKDLEKKINLDDLKIKAVPLWKWLLNV